MIPASYYQSDADKLRDQIDKTIVKAKLDSIRKYIKEERRPVAKMKVVKKVSTKKKGSKMRLRKEWISLCNIAKFLNKQPNVDIVFVSANPDGKEAKYGTLVAKTIKDNIIILPSIEKPEEILVMGYPINDKLEYALGKKQKMVPHMCFPDTIYGIRVISRVLNRASKPNAKKASTKKKGDSKLQLELNELTEEYAKLCQEEAEWAREWSDGWSRRYTEMAKVREQIGKKMDEIEKQ